MTKKVVVSCQLRECKYNDGKICTSNVIYITTNGQCVFSPVKPIIIKK